MNELAIKSRKTTRCPSFETVTTSYDISPDWLSFHNIATCHPLFVSLRPVCHLCHFSHSCAMDKQQNQCRAHFVPILLCCFLLACSGIVYGIYTYREISWLKVQIRLHHKVIVALQDRAHTSDFQVRKYISLNILRWIANSSPVSKFQFIDN